ncbi:MAG: hypothetical protein ACRERV_05065 [Methylococcales bacterium]
MAEKFYRFIGVCFGKTYPALAGFFVVCGSTGVAPKKQDPPIVFQVIVFLWLGDQDSNLG